MAAAFLIGAAPAAADDATLFAAYTARQAPELAPANEAYKAAFAVVERSDGRRGARGVIRANHGLNRILTAIEGVRSSTSPRSGCRRPTERSRRRPERQGCIV